MLVNRVPWQFAAGQMLIWAIVYISSLLISLILGIFGWMPFIAGLTLFFSFIVLVGMIPLFMNMSRGFFGLLLVFLGAHILVTILSYAFQYFHSGIFFDKNTIIHTFRDSLYFSVTTWTTLGYGDFSPVPEMRLITSLEAMTGVISMAITAAFVWLWCTENMIPKEKAFFDGNRRHKQDLCVHRMRIRTLTGKKRNLGDEWVAPPVLGQSYIYDKNKEEWIEFTNDIELEEGIEILEPRDDKLK